MIRYDIITNEFELDDGQRFSYRSFEIAKPSLPAEQIAEYEAAVVIADAEAKHILDAIFPELANDFLKRFPR